MSRDSEAPEPVRWEIGVEGWQLGIGHLPRLRTGDRVSFVAEVRPSAGSATTAGRLNGRAHVQGHRRVRQSLVLVDLGFPAVYEGLAIGSDEEVDTVLRGDLDLGVHPFGADATFLSIDEPEAMVTSWIVHRIQEVIATAAGDQLVDVAVTAARHPERRRYRLTCSLSQ